MHGDISRSTFSERHGFRAVQLQQGRVLLDAEWNEQAALTAHHDEVRTSDVVGRSGGPLPAGGGSGPFAIRAANGSAVAGTAWADLVVTPGRYYADGVLAESFPPATAAGWPLTDQPHLPAVGPGDAGLPEPPASPDGTRYALYLQVGEQHVTADDEPRLRESALGGPDTATRVRTTWHVGWTRLTAGEVCLDLHAAGWLARTPRTMTAALRPADADADADPCRISTSGGYRRLENQLYRVQIHGDGSDGGAPTFLWSRENGSVVSALLKITPSALPGIDAVLGQDRVGRDDELSVRENDLVEVTSTTRQLRGQRGFLARAGAPNGLDLPVTWLADAPVTLASLGRTPVVRRWEGGPTQLGTAATDLEDGITVRFPAGGTAAVGDYWLIPARTVRLAYGLSELRGTIDWPPRPGGPLAAPPAGPVHHIAPLAVLERTGGAWTLESDCRSLFPPLTGLAAIDLVGGDGQEDLPGEWLDEPVRVVVRQGAFPVVGAPVEFTVPDGGDLADATLPGDPVPADPLPLVLPTGPDGVASVMWRPAAAGPVTQCLRVRCLDDHAVPTGVEVAATARHSIAAEVAWSRPDCAGFAEVTTVGGALDRLVDRLELRLRGGDGQHPGPGALVLPQPIRVIVDNACGPVAGVPVNALSFGSALVAPATEGDPVPDDLTGSGGVTVDSTSTADGAALFWWQPDLSTGSDRLEIRLPGEDLHAPITVTAQRKTAGGQRDGVHIESVVFGTNEPFENDSDVTAKTLSSGIIALLDGEIAVPALRGKPIVRVELELPWPLLGDGRELAEEPVGTRTVTLDGLVDIDLNVIGWKPGRSATWLVDSLWKRLLEAEWFEPILGRYFLEGWAVPTLRPPGMQINTHFDVADKGGRVLAILPTDDAVTGGTFVHWFRLHREAP